MTKSFDELMKMLEEKGTIPDEEGAKIVKEHGALTDEEKKNLAAAIRMKKALTKDAATPDAKEGEKTDDKPAGEKEAEEVTMDAYLQALSTLDSDEASKEDKEQAQKVKDKFESQ